MQVTKSVSSTERINTHQQMQQLTQQGNNSLDRGGYSSAIRIHPNLVEDYSGQNYNQQHLIVGHKNHAQQITRNNSGSLIQAPNFMHARTTSHHTFMRPTPPNHFQTEAQLPVVQVLPEHVKPLEHEKPKSLRQLHDLEEQNRKRLQKYDSQRESCQGTFAESNQPNNNCHQNSSSIYQNQKLFSSQDELVKVTDSQIVEQQTEQKGKA